MCELHMALMIADYLERQDRLENHTDVLTELCPNVSENSGEDIYQDELFTEK
jgi:hypothetical protein